jgi:neutral ceramidase
MKHRTFHAGWAATDITPPLGVPLSGYYVSEGRGTCAVDVADPLTAKALVMDDGNGCVAIVGADLIQIPDPLLRRVRAAITTMSGIASDRIIVSATHNHSGPTLGPVPQGPNLYPGMTNERYVDLLVDQFATVVELARRRMVPCRVGVGVGSSTINVNRRQRRDDGSFMPLPFLGQNPDGPIDRSVTVVKVANDAGAALLWVNYACHAVVLGPNVEISGDYPGAMQRFLERAYGGSTLALFTTGAQGDLNPIIHPGTYADAERLGRELAGEVIRVAESIELREPGRLAVERRELTLPVRRSPALDEDEIRLAELLLVAEEKRARTPLPAVVQEEMDYSVEKMRNLRRQAHPDGIPIEMTAVALDDVAFCTIPGELFNAVGQQIKAAAPSGTTFLVGLANGSIGYLPNREAYDEGGFEVQASPLDPGAAELFRDVAIDLLASVRAVNP